MVAKSNLALFKYGGETVTTDFGVDKNRINGHARRIARSAWNLIVVSSGAVAAGKAEAKAMRRDDIEEDQVFAGLGSAAVVEAWKIGLKKYGVLASQVPVTDHEVDDKEEGPILKDSISSFLRYGIVPIVNTNDQLSYKELDKRRWNGENDGLAAHLACELEVSALFLMTSRDGVFDEEKQRIPVVPYYEEEQEAILEMVRGRGGPEYQGITAKVTAAIKVARCGIDAYIACADISPEAIVAGRAGTHFVATS